MPYYITEESESCPAWSVIKEDGEVIACHDTKESAIDQAIAISLAEETEFVGERAAVGQLMVEDYVTWDVNNAKILAEVVMVEGQYAVVEVYELEDGVYHSTDRLMIMNVFKLVRVPRPEFISEEIEDEEEDSEGNLEEDYSEEDRAEPDALEIGDSVSWDSSGGRARGVIEKIERNGTINVPDSDFTITGTEENPAALIRVYRDGEEGLEPTDVLVGHRFSTLTKIESLDEN